MKINSMTIIALALIVASLGLFIGLILRKIPDTIFWVCMIMIAMMAFFVIPRFSR